MRINHTHHKPSVSIRAHPWPIALCVLCASVVNSRIARRLSILLSLALALTVGCRRSEPPKPQAAAEVEPKPAAAESEPKSEAIESLKVAAEAEEPEPEPRVEPEPAFEWPDEELRERIILIAPGGPLVVDVWLSIDGRSHREGVEEIIDTALAAGDTNGDGRKTWKEWRENVEYFSQVVPNQAPNRRQLDMWEDTYDQNGDHRIQRHEIAAWLGRDAGRSAAGLSLRSRRSRGSGRSIDSRLWDLLDLDQSVGLSHTEMALASDALWMLDADDDRTLVDAELTPLEDQLAGNQGNQVRASRVARRHAALHFGPHFDTGRLGYLLADLYSPRGTLSAESFADLPGLFDELDDGDQWLGDDDLARLGEIEPHVRMAMTFDSDSPSPTIDQIDLSPRVERLAVAARPSDSRMVLTFGKTRLVFSVHDLAGADGPTENLRRSQTQLMVHDECDVLFEYVDSNSDGRLGEREVTTASDRLADCDLDGDGLLSTDELPYTMIVAFQRGDDLSARNFYVPASPAIAESDSGAPRWFAAADFNGDGDLGRREFLGPTNLFGDLDSNGDGFIDVSEAMAADNSERLSKSD